MQSGPSEQELAPNRSMPPGIIIPELSYDDVPRAAAWLCTWFGFRERMRIGAHRSQLVYAGASIVVVGPGRAGDSGSHALMVRVVDVDSHYERVKDSGARIVSSPESFPFGERQYSVEDPGGHRWTFTESVADVDPAEWGGEVLNPD